MTTEEIFLVDSNSFMTPYRLYYAFDLVPAYWDAIIQHIKSGRIVILDMVKAEIEKGEDDLSEWLASASELTVIPHVNEKTIEKYQQIIRFIATSGFYRESALTIWSQRSVADPWLIASASANGFTLVTEEVGTSGLTKKNPQKKAKIPDVAGKFDVKTINVYEMMRKLGIVIK